MEQPKPKQYKTNVPKADKDFDTLVTNVNTKWEQNQWLTLLWITQPQFATTATAYTASLNQRDMTASRRGGLTATLEDLDRKIDKGETYIKNYLSEKFDSNPEAHYAAFGIVHGNEKYTIPHDRDTRKNALLLILPALAQFGFEDKKYGLAYWQEIAMQYPQQLLLASAKDGATSTETGSKNVNKAQLKEALNSIVLVLKGNYPGTWKSVLRDWGFQKEKY